MRITISHREQRTLLLLGLLGVVILWVYGAYLIAPLGRKAAELAQQLAQARERVRALELVTGNEPSLQRQYEELNRTVASMRDALPAERELPATIELLSGLASQAQVKIQTISPLRGLEDPAPESSSGPAGKVPVAPIVYKPALIQIDALAGYHQLGMFLSLIEGSDKPLQLSSLHITASPRESGRQQVRVVIRAFFAVKAPETSSEIRGVRRSPSFAENPGLARGAPRTHS